MNGTLVIVRHTESEWNATGRWTGLTDVNITQKGQHDAEAMGRYLRDFHFDKAFVSEQIRTLQTLRAVLSVQGQTDLSYERCWAINERDYGEYTGLNKWEVKEKVGNDIFNAIRREWDYPVPGGETLKNVYHRAVPFYQSKIVPLLERGQTVLLVSHGNAIRALMKYIEDITDEAITGVEMVFGTIVVYKVDKNGRLVSKDVRQVAMDLPPA